MAFFMSTRTIDSGSSPLPDALALSAVALVPLTDLSLLAGTLSTRQVATTCFGPNGAQESTSFNRKGS